ncbi:unnamed protein product [Effrenium voratum]|nr:unnamed protein product [Effrenium voratum]
MASASGCASLRARLCERLHGSDPYASPWTLEEDHSYRHTNVPQVFLSALFQRLRPELSVEVGSFKGGSALRILSALDRTSKRSCLVCIDTFLGDASMWLNRRATGRGSLQLHRGHPQIYEQFMANTQSYADSPGASSSFLKGWEEVVSLLDYIVPFPVASLSGLRALQLLAAEEGFPRPDFIYLDSAHLKGETLLEITEAFRLLRPGGVLMGDDLDWPAVEEDLRIFAGGCSDLSGENLGVSGSSFFAGGYWMVEAEGCGPRQWLLQKAQAVETR